MRLMQVAELLLGERPAVPPPGQHPAAAAEQVTEPAFLVEQHAHDLLGPGGLPEVIQRLRDQPQGQVGQRPGRIIAPQRGQRPADQPAQHVAAPGAGRRHAVPDDHHAGPQVVADQPPRGLVHRPQAADGVRRGPEQVGAEYRVLALEHHDQPLQAQAGIHAGPGQGHQGAVVQAPVAQHDVVPHLDPAPVRARGPLRRGTAGPHEQFGVRATQPGRAVRPPVVHPGQLGRDAQLAPDLQQAGVRADLIAAAEDGGLQPARVDAESAGDQLVTPAQALLTGVVTERPRAEHLENGQVGAVPDLVEVGGAQAALHAGEPPAAGVRLPFQVRRERVHARRGEQDRIPGPGHQRAARDGAMPAFAEEVEERVNDLL